MHKNKFQLTNYLTSIMNIAAANKITPAVALQCFIANLSTMREHYEGAPHLNYHTLGQQWNNLPNQERVAQRAEAHKKLLEPKPTAKK